MTEDIIGKRGRATLDLNQLCTATNARGEPCGSPAIRGGFVCRHHGGNTPQAQRAAQQRLWSMVDPAMAHIQRVLITKPDCEHCGRSDDDLDPTKIRAAIAILDRAGFGPSATLNLEPARADWAPYLTHEELEQFGQMMRAAKERMAAGEPVPSRQQPPPPLLKPQMELVLVNQEKDEATITVTYDE